jgi:hypothetical protein
LLDDVLVDFAGGYVVVAGGLDVEETFVVAEVEVGFGAVVSNEDFAVFVGLRVPGSTLR